MGGGEKEGSTIVPNAVLISGRLALGTVMIWLTFASRAGVKGRYYAVVLGLARSSKG